jgi:Tfp pilus assembly protein PilV
MLLELKNILAFVRGRLLCRKQIKGFTIPEVIIAGVIMIVLCVGTLTMFSYAVKINRGNNLRMQALAVLQLEVEHYRSLKFVPGLEAEDDLDNHRLEEIFAGTHNRPSRTSADGRVFNITVQVVNQDGLAEHLTKFKTITINAEPQVAETEGWLQNLGTNVTVQRTRSN